MVLVNVFERIEQKYILDKKQYKLLMKLMDKYFLKDLYYKSSIYNIYFDNDNNDLIINSLEKPVYKEKVRLRSYLEVKSDNDTVFLEVKKKYNGVVYKRRVKLKYFEYMDYIKKRIIPNDNKKSQIMKEIDYYINYYKLHPYIFVGYDRLSYYAKDDINFRVTFDSNLRSRKNDLELRDTDDNKRYFDSDKYIMEVKCLNALPIWFVSYLSECEIYPRSFSKVGSIYLKEGR